MSRVGRNVRMFRERLGLTQAQLSERVHYEPSMIYQIEQGLKSPSLEKAQDLAIQLGVSLSELVGETYPVHAVTNNAHGDHTVIQNIDGRYCALSQAQMQALLREELALLRTQLVAELLGLLQPGTDVPHVG